MLRQVAPAPEPEPAKRPAIDYGQLLKRAVGRIKNKKNVEFIILGVIILAILLSYASTLWDKAPDEQPLPSNLLESGAQEDLTEYSGTLEKKLAQILSQIVGVGDVNVMITFESGPIVETATGLGQEENAYPKVQGVLVVAEGAGDLGVKAKVLDAVRIALNLPADQVQVFERTPEMP